MSGTELDNGDASVVGDVCEEGLVEDCVGDDAEEDVL